MISLTQRLSLCLVLFISYALLVSKKDNQHLPLVMSISSAGHQEIVQEDSIVAPGAQLKHISSQFKFTEGPAVDRQGDVYFTDQPNDRIWKYDQNGELSMFMENTGRSNGLYIDRNDNIISCADARNELWRISKQKAVTVLTNSFHGENFNGPNDVWVCPKAGGMYFTDPLYKRPYWEEGRTHIKKEMVYYLPRNKKEAFIVDSTIVKPNGIVGTPDGKFLYVADIGDNKTYRYSISRNGKLTDRVLFVTQGSDGMTIDNKGNIYLTGKGVTVYNPDGKKIAEIPVPENWTANVCFFGKDRNKLFITASKSVYELAMNVRGVN